MMVNITFLSFLLFSMCQSMHDAVNTWINCSFFTLIRDKDGDRFLKRKNPSWYPRMENSLFDYIRGNMTDDELTNLIKDEQLEEDLHHIREHL